MKGRVDIGVGGRFHGDFLFSELSKRDWEPHLYTSFPKSRFPDIPPTSIHPHLWGECVFRIARKTGLENWGDLYKMRSFGKAAARDIQSSAHRASVFIGWSSFSLETLRLGHADRSILIRDSTHIRFQSRLLAKEYEKTATPWPDRQACEDRELQEYELADQIVVLSEFARKTFEEEGVNPAKVHVVPLGLDLSRFQPKPPSLPRLPLKVVYFGSLSVRKGVHYLLEAISEFAPEQLEVTLIGGAEPHFHRAFHHLPHVRFLGPLPQAELARSLQEFDVFVFPTLEDGFGQTLPQAMATGLVPIVTENCGAKDLVVNGENGFRIPPQDAGAIRRHLIQLTEEPNQIREMSRNAVKSVSNRTWDKYGEEFERLLELEVTPTPLHPKHQTLSPQRK